MFGNMKKPLTDNTTTTPSRDAAKHERPGGRFQAELRAFARRLEQRRGTDARRTVRLKAFGPRHPIFGPLH